MGNMSKIYYSIVSDSLHGKAKPEEFKKFCNDMIKLKKENKRHDGTTKNTD
jgi:hypothetical protein